MKTVPKKPPIERGQTPRKSRRHQFGIIAAIVILLILVGALPRIMRMIELNRYHRQLVSRIRRNDAVRAALSPQMSTLTLPGDIQSIQQVPILARADGYLQRRLVDIGDRVKQGQLLAVISAPDLDEQFLQSQADLKTQLANLDNAKATYVHYIAQWHAATATVKQSRANVAFDLVEIKRYNYLAKEGAVSVEIRDSFLRQLVADKALLKTNLENEQAARLQADASLEAVHAAETTVASYSHNAQRLAALQGYRNVYAPYDGVITARYIDPGQLVQSGGTGTQILAMGSLDVLRILVQAPQSVFRSIHQGDVAEITVPEFPNRTFPGVVTNVSGGLDTQSRTLQVEVHVDNKQHILPVGIYGNVHFKISSAINTCIIPVNAISARATGNFVVVIINGRAHFREIDIFRDEGAKVQVSTGVQPGDIVLLDPPDDLQENERVEPIFSKPGAAPS